MNQVRWIILITKGILHDRVTRREVLFWIVAAALVLLGVGAGPLDGWLTGHPWGFLVFWGACAWLTLAALLMAFYDLLAVRREGLHARRELKRRIFGDDEDGNKGGRP
jgi:hypothetical protein